MTNSILFSPLNLKGISLKNRIVMAPMTRCRAEKNIPSEAVALYYGQRAEAGMIITEGTSPSPNGLGYARIPGLFSEEQVRGWRKVTDAVHLKGGVIVAQLMHTGRVGHPLNLPEGAELVAPSAVAAPDSMYTDAEGMQACPVPREMTESDIEKAIDEFVQSAKNARLAGFDGVELHGANGYLIDQFLNLASNQRTDAWGGTVDGRANFALSTARRVVSAIGAERVGIRLSPAGGFNGMGRDKDTDALYLRLADALSDIGAAYIHLVDHSTMGAPKPSVELVRAIRKRFKGTLILSGGYTASRAVTDLAEDACDLVAFGRPFIANPDLVSRLRGNGALREPDPATFYTPGERGYTDY